MAKTMMDTPTGQVKVETGEGVIKEIKQGEGKRNAQVIIEADHLKFGPITGWYDTWSDGWDQIAVGQRVHYEIRTKRKDNVDPTIPLDDIKNPRDKVRDMVLLVPEGSAPPRPQPQQSQPVQHARPSVSPAARPIPTPPKAVCGECGYGPDLCTCDSPAPGASVMQAGLDATKQRHELMNGVTQPSRDDLFDQATSFGGSGGLPIPPPPGRGPKIQEGKPWEEHNTDGSLNLASYSFSAVNGFVQLAHKLVADRIRKLTEEGAPTGRMTTTTVEHLARFLLVAADRAQAATRKDGRVDRMDGSHTRARSAVREALWVYPVPWGVDDETRGRWLDSVAEHAAELMRVALVLHEEYAEG